MKKYLIDCTLKENNIVDMSEDEINQLRDDREKGKVNKTKMDKKIKTKEVEKLINEAFFYVNKYREEKELLTAGVISETYIPEVKYIELLQYIHALRNIRDSEEILTLEFPVMPIIGGE